MPEPLDLESIARHHQCMSSECPDGCDGGVLLAEVRRLREEMAAYLKLGDETDAALTAADAELAELRPIVEAVATSLYGVVSTQCVLAARAWRAGRPGQ